MIFLNVTDFKITAHSSTSNVFMHRSACAAGRQGQIDLYTIVYDLRWIGSIYTKVKNLENSTMRYL